MPITDKTRKVLWVRSGNQCAICKHELVTDATADDDVSIVGEECHIISPRENGPRHDPSYHDEKLDSYENLILLCRIHHKMVDDQEATFTTAILRQMKSNHEVTVSDKLANKLQPKPLKVRRIRSNIPEYLFRLTSGKQVVDIVTGVAAFSMDHDELKSQEEVDLVGGFLQTVEDWVDLSGDLEAMDRVRTAYDLTSSLQKLEEAGFFLFGGREVQLLEGGILSEPSNWPVAILRVLRKDNQTIVRVDFDERTKENTQPTEKIKGPVKK